MGLARFIFSSVGMIILMLLIIIALKSKEYFAFALFIGLFFVCVYYVIRDTISMINYAGEKEE